MPTRSATVEAMIAVAEAKEQVRAQLRTLEGIEAELSEYSHGNDPRVISYVLIEATKAATAISPFLSVCQRLAFVIDRDAHRSEEPMLERMSVITACAQTPAPEAATIE